MEKERESYEAYRDRMSERQRQRKRERERDIFDDSLTNSVTDNFSLHLIGDGFKLCKTIQLSKKFLVRNVPE